MFGKNSICWTGHRTLDKIYLNPDNPTILWKQLNSSVFNFIKRAYTEGWNNIVVGGALGVDMLVGLVVADMITTRIYPKLRLHLCIPHANYNNMWIKPSDRESLEYLKRVANNTGSVQVLHTGVYDKSTAGRILNQRNHFMVDNTTITTAVWDGRVERSGTYNCLEYARGRGKTRCIMNPLIIDNNTGFCQETWENTNAIYHSKEVN